MDETTCAINRFKLVKLGCATLMMAFQVDNKAIYDICNNRLMSHTLT
jgi:hypothetical protein